MIKPVVAPYATTKIDARKTQADIDTLLDKYGVTDVQWTREGDQITLNFLTEVEIEGVVRRIGFQFNPPLFTTTRKTWNKEKGRYDTLQLPNLAQSMRLLHDYLKNKLAAVAWGLRPFEEEFLAEVIVQTPKGTIRFAEMVRRQGLLALPEAIEP